MKSVINQPKEKEIEFPCLMHYVTPEKIEIVIIVTGVASSGTYEGTCVHFNVDNCHDHNMVDGRIGEFSMYWSSSFKPFYGSITIGGE